MVRRKLQGRNFPQLTSTDFLDTNVIDTNYEEVEDYPHSNNTTGHGWQNRAHRAGHYARGAYTWGQNYSRGITPAMEDGASSAIGTLGTVASHTNPFRPWRSFAFWSMSIGTLIVGGWVAQFFLGGLIATRNPRQLPQNTPTAVRFGHGVVNAGKPVASGVWNGFEQVATGAGDSLDRAVRIQTGGFDSWQQPPVNVEQAPQTTTTLPLTTWTGDGGYPSTGRK
jgi:hypothetical protein